MLIGPDLTCGVKTNDVKEITASLFQVVWPYTCSNAVSNIELGLVPLWFGV